MSGVTGWRVLLARPAGRSSGLISLLGAAGAQAMAVPLIAIAPPLDPAALDAAVLALAVGDYSWVGFTSVNAVAAVVDRARSLSITTVVPAGTRTAVVGPATADALRRAGIAVDLLPRSGGSVAVLAQEFPAAGPGETALLPQSEIASPMLATALQDKGFEVSAVHAYRTEPVPPTRAVAQDLAAGAFDAILLTSPSTVAALTGVSIDRSTLIGAIGSTTARAITEAGLPLDFMAAAPTDEALLAGLLTAAGRRGRTSG